MATTVKQSDGYHYTPPKPNPLFQHVLGPMYDWTTQFLPRWWTPNGITLFGIACTTAGSVLYFGPFAATAKQPTPEFNLIGPLRTIFAPAEQWHSHVASGRSSTFGPAVIDSSLLIAVGLLNTIYCFADNLDGRQARRLKSSSAIGEYLDHGLDCVTSLLSTAMLVTCAGLSLNAAALAVACVAFQTALSHVCNLRRNVFIYGTKWGSVDEAMTAFGLLPVLTALFPAYRDVTLAVIGLPSVRLVDLGFASFLFGQVAFVREVVAVMPDSWYHPTTVFQGLLLAAFGVVAAVHEGGSAPNIMRQFRHADRELGWLPGASSYPVMWLLTASCAASMVVHDPIIAKCVAKVSGAPDITKGKQGVVPYVAAAASLGVFYLCPHGGATIAVASHVALVCANVFRLQRAAAGRAAKKE